MASEPQPEDGKMATSDHPSDLAGTAAEDIAEDLEAVRQKSATPTVQYATARAREHVLDGDYAEAIEEIDAALPDATVGRGEELAELRDVVAEFARGER